MNTLINAWRMLPFHIDPILVRLGPFEIHWYSLLYMTAILVTFGLFINRARKLQQTQYLNISADILLYAIIGIVLGARLGYVLCYQLTYYLAHPLEIFLPFANGQFVGISGLSYHGGAIGFLLAMLLLCNRNKLSFFQFTNAIVPYIPLGYTFGRIGNFLNLELYGRQTTSWIGMVFPSDPERLIRYPSQLFEATGEGLLLFFLLWLLRKNKKTATLLTPIYTIGYGSIRFFLEFFREPDSFQQLLGGILSYGQGLSIVMIILGISLIPLYRKYG